MGLPKYGYRTSPGRPTGRGRAFPSTSGECTYAGDVAATVPVLVAVIALLGVFFGHIYSQAAQRRVELGRTFADALSAVTDWEDMRFQIRRRPSSTPEVRWAVAQRVSERLTRQDFFVAWMNITAPLQVAEKYQALVGEVRRVCNPHIHDAWDHPPVESDAEMNIGLGAEYPVTELDPIRAECVAAMREYLRPGIRKHFRRSS
jgi:hypothetical protein